MMNESYRHTAGGPGVPAVISKEYVEVLLQCLEDIHGELAGEEGGPYEGGVSRDKLIKLRGREEGSEIFEKMDLLDCGAVTLDYF